MADPSLQWHYVRDGITVGPVDTPALVRLAASRAILPRTPVWNATFGRDWRPAGAVPELSAAFAGPPAATSPAAGLPPPFPGDDAPPAPLPAFQSAWAWTRQVLLRPFRFFQWLVLWVAFWLASAWGGVGVFDQQTLLHEAPRVRTAGETAGLALVALVKGMETIFDSGYFANWLLFFAVVSFATCYFRARGNLMLVHFADHPGDPLGSAWRRARPGVWPLALFLFILDLVRTAALLASLRHFTDSLPPLGGAMPAKALLRSLAENGTGLRWLAFGAAALVVVGLVRSVTYHFAVPLVYRFGIRTRHAWLYVVALFLRHPLRFLGYYLALALLHLLLWTALGGLLLVFGIATLPLAAVAAPLAAVFAAFLPAFGRFVAIPFLYLIRCAGPRFLDAWRKDLR